MKTLALVSLFPMCAAFFACATHTTTTDETADANEAAASAAQSSRFEQMIVAPITSHDPAQSASSLAAAQWWPAGCATRQKDATNPNLVHIHLDDCTGPFGLRHHTGDINVTFSQNADGTLHAHVESSNMTVNGHAVTFNREKDITVSGTTRTVKSTGEWTRVAANGETIEHTSSTISVIDLSSGCRTTNGSSVKTRMNGREVDSTIKDYKLCKKADGTESCPSGTITHTHQPSGKTFTVTFDGSATATLTGPKNGTVQVPLVCTP